MRILSGICSIAIVLSTYAAQVEEDGPYSIHLVRKLLQSPVLQATGFGEKQVNRLGDRVSIALIKILNEEDLRNPEEVRKILPLIRAAFVAPQIITVPEDKKPAVTLLLLNYLETTVQDGILKKEILDLKDFVREKTAGAT
jgi:hypothetical protein